MHVYPYLTLVSLARSDSPRVGVWPARLMLSHFVPHLRICFPPSSNALIATCTLIMSASAINFIGEANS